MKAYKILIRFLFLREKKFLSTMKFDRFKPTKKWIIRRIFFNSFLNLQRHIGRDVWLQSSIYNNIIIKSDTPQKFVGNVVTSVFGEEVLLRSTVTGRSSNRSKKNKSIPNNTDDESETDSEEKPEQSRNDVKPDQLDPTKTLACRGNRFNTKK